MPQYKVCNCPRCHHSGISVGAMHYRETQQWHKSGTFSGSGIGVGTGGIGVGFGSGTYSESGEIATKRANEFAEPQPYTVQFMHLILPLIISLIAINGFPFLFQMMSSMAPQGNAHANFDIEQLTPFISFFNTYVVPLYGVFTFIIIIRRVIKSQQEEHELNTTLYPKQLERYNELRYCENCHTIYDHNNNAENANEIGMNKMMQISPGQ